MDNSIGKRIKSRRNELGITQTQIFNETGISTGNLSGIETGKSLPSSTALIALSKVLQCTTDWILIGSSPISENLQVSDMEKDFIMGFRVLSNDDQEELFEILKIKLKRSKKQKCATTFMQIDAENQNIE